MSLHIETHGRGPDLVMLHGWGMHGAIWGDSLAVLAETHRVHVVDLPGMGHSAAIEPYTLAQLAVTLLEAMPGPAVVCGWSFGGLLAMQMAATRPDWVERLVLIGATPRFVTGDDWACGMDAGIFREFARQVAADYQGTLQRFLALQAFGNASSRTLLKQLRERFLAGPLPDHTVMQQALDILLQSDLRSLARQLPQPVLAVHGERDTLAPVSAARWLEDHLPHASLIVIPGASHAPFLSHPGLFMQALNHFLES